MGGRKKTYYASPIDRRGEREIRPDPLEVARLKAEIPDDTRNVTGRVLGDPLPGRRALDLRRAGARRERPTVFTVTVRRRSED